MQVFLDLVSTPR